MQTIYGVVDIGTLKVKSEIARLEPNGSLARLASRATLTCFGVGMDESGGRPQEKYLLQTLAELKHVKDEFKKFGVQKFRIVSTHAMRKAVNRDDIIARIKKEVGFMVENISQEQEAELFFLSVMKTFIPEGKKYAVIDVGGGSVQILVGTKRKLEAALMTKTGTISLHEKYVRDPHNPESVTTRENLQAMKDEIMQSLLSLHAEENIPLIYGSSMIIDIMQGLKMRLDPHEDSSMHPYKTYAHHLLAIIDELIPMNFGARDKAYPLPHGYAWGLDSAFINVITTANYFKSPYIIPSNANIAQGIIYSMI